MRAADRDPIDRFDAALEAFRRGETPAPEQLDPVLLAAAARLRAMDRAQRPDPRLADHIWAELMNDAGLSGAPSLPSVATSAPIPLNGRSAPRPWRATTADSIGRARRRLPLSALAVAAVLVLVLTAGLLALRFAAPEQNRNVLDAAHRPAVETLVDAAVDNPAPSWTPLTVQRWIFPPGDAALVVPPLDGPQWIVAEGRGLVVTIGGNELRLTPGAGIVVSAGQQLALRNDSENEAAVLRGVAASRFVLEDYDQTRITKQTALDSEAHEALPPGSSRLVFERLTLLTGTALVLEPANGQDWLDVTAGTLGLTMTGDGLPLNWQSGREREVQADERLPALRPGTRATLRNIGDEPLVLLRLRVLPPSNSGGS
jgi:hypothetical protein